MNAEKETKLKEKLAIWRGFEWWSIHLDEDKVDGIKWKPLGGVEILMNDSKGDMPYLSIMNNNKEVGCPDFPIDLNACFKWLVPKLIAEGFAYDLFSWQDNQHKIIISKPSEREEGGWGKIVAEVVAEVVGDTPALALCLVIEKLIDNEKR